MCCSSDISHLVSESIGGVSVVYICPLLDEIYGKNRWFDVDISLRFDHVVDWIQKHGAHYYAWEGPSFYRLAERNNAVEQAIKLGKFIVVIEPLS